MSSVSRANTTKMTDRAFLGELKHWISFDGSEALRNRDGPRLLPEPR
jgi:hypothetical protein